MTDASPPILQLATKLKKDHHAIYLGRQDGHPIFGSSEDHLLVIGPPRSGKTSRILTPTVACHPGPVIAVSTRPDLLADSVAARRTIASHYGGTVQQLSLAGSHIEPGLATVRWNLTDGCDQWETARDRAATVVAAAVPPAHGTDTIWRDSASVALSGCLHAAKLLGHSDARMASYIRSADLHYYQNSITRRYCKADTNQRHPAAQSFDWLSNDHVIAPNTRSSVFFVLSQQVLSAFDYKAVDAKPQRASKFVSSAASTMYLTIPYERRQQAAPLVSAFIEAVVAAWRQQRRAHARKDDATLLLVLDEAANISPLPSLAGLLTSGAGDGIQVVFALQEPSQSKAWGDDAGAVLSGSRLLSILPGVRDEEYLANLAQLSHKEVAYDLNVIVSPEWVGGDRYATAERLIQERQYLERQLRGEPSRRHHFLRLKAAQPVARQRRRDGIRCIEDDTANVLSVLEEIMTYTDVSTLVDRRPTLEVSELTQASPNTIAFFAGSTYRKLDIVHWREDELWKRVLSN